MVHKTEYETKNGRTTVKKPQDGQKRDSAGNQTPTGKDKEEKKEAASWQ